MAAVKGISFPTAELAGMIGQSILYGMSVLLSGLALFLLLTRRTRDRTTLWLSGFLITMFCLSTAYLSIVSYYIVEGFVTASAQTETQLPGKGDPRVWLPTLLENINCMLGDLIVIWRIWVLWERKQWTVILPMIFWVGGTVATILELRANVTESNAQIATFSHQGSTVWGLTFLAMTFITNLVGVLLIGYRYWTYRKNVLAVLSHRTGNEYILVLLVESGAFYCCTWIVQAIVFSSTSNGLYVVLPMITQLTNIFPTLIIVLVCLKITHSDKSVNTLHRSTVSYQSDRVRHAVYTRQSSKPASDYTKDSFTDAIDLAVRKPESTYDGSMQPDCDMPCHVVQLTPSSSMAFRNTSVAGLPYRNSTARTLEYDHID